MTAALRVIPILNGQFMQNCYLLAEDGAADAVIVDPGEAPALFLETAARHGLTIREIWLTHGHIDHVSGVGAIKAQTGAPIFLHPADVPLYRNLAQQARMFGLALDDPPPIDRELAHGDTLTLGGTTFAVRHTPGHSPGSVCFITPGTVIGGDVLFQGSVGRTDLPGGDWEQLLRSIEDELFVLPDDTVVHPGHGPQTTIGAEKRTNPFLRGLAG